MAHDWFFNKLELNYQKYKTNGTVRDKSYKGGLLFSMKYFVPFVTDIQSKIMSTRLLKYNIDELHVPKFQLCYIRDKTHPSRRNMVELCPGVHYMWWGDQELELQ